MSSAFSRLKAGRQIAIEYLATSSLTPDPNNARVHSKKQIAKLGAAIGRFGFVNPILVDEDLGVIAGHARLAAAAERKLAMVPCVRLAGLTLAEKKALAIADNKLGDMSAFDPAMLSKALFELEGLDFDVEFTGFDTAEVDMLIGVAPAVRSDPDDVVDTAAAGPAVTVAGDLWQLGEHRLLCGNALEATSYDALLGGERAEMIFTDMPYNVSIPNHASGLGKARHEEFAMASGEMNPREFTGFLTTSMQNMAAYSADGSLHFQCMDWRHASEMLVAGDIAYAELKAICVWNKGSGGMGSLYRSQHEFVFVFKHGTAVHINNVELGKHGRYRTNVWDYPGLNRFGKGRDEDLASHPTVKPVALVADAIRDCSNRGGLILDPFAGSGTTILAAERTRRRAAAMELEPAYIDVAVRRWQARTGGEATLVDDGRTFAEIEAARCGQENNAPPPGGG